MCKIPFLGNKKTTRRWFAFYDVNNIDDMIYFERENVSSKINLTTYILNT